jgi:hypothetical protein
MRAPDRDAFFKLNDAFMAVHPEFQSIYYGLEDGMFAGHGFSSRIANYREPGHSGYLLDDSSGEVRAQEEGMEKYFKHCLNSTNGDLLDCEMAVGGKYTSCINDCELIKCADELSQQDCSTTYTSSSAEMNTTAESRMECGVSITRYWKQPTKRDGDTSREERIVSIRTVSPMKLRAI